MSEISEILKHKAEQRRIKLAIIEAIPVNTDYANIVAALADLTGEFARDLLMAEQNRGDNESREDFSTDI